MWATDWTFCIPEGPTGRSFPGLKSRHLSREPEDEEQGEDWPVP